jgi:hypothetical protein
VAHPHVADRGEGLQIQRVAVNIFNKQSRIVDKGWSILGVGRGDELSPKNMLRNVTKRIGPGLILWQELSNEKRTWDLGLREIGIDGANRIRLNQDRFQWRAFVSTVMKLRVP